MAWKGVFVLQLFIPFILYLVREWIVCKDHISISDSFTSFGLCFSIIIVLNVNKNIQVVRNKYIIAVALFIIFAFGSLIYLDDQINVISFFPNVFCCVHVLWTQFWNFFDNSWKNITICIRRKWINILKQILHLFLWLIIIGILKQYCFDEYRYLSYRKHVLYYYVTFVEIGYTDIRTPKVDVQLNQKQKEKETYTIRFDMDNNRTLYDNERHLPICQHVFQRSMGEDLTIQCKWPKKCFRFIDYEIKWTHNDNEIVNSDRKKIHSSRGIYNVETLNIFFIDKDDFGKYLVWVSSNSTKMHMRKYNKISYIIASVVLTKLDDVMRYIYMFLLEMDLNLIIKLNIRFKLEY